MKSEEFMATTTTITLEDVAIDDLQSIEEHIGEMGLMFESKTVTV